MKSNAYVKIKDNINYYDDIYNFLFSKKRNTKEYNKINWKNVIYPAELNNIKEKVKKDKKKQNFRELANKYVLDNNNVLFIKIINKNKEIEKLKVPYETEKISLFLKYHDNNGHIGYKRMMQEIKNNNYYWKSLRNDCKQYVLECPTCIKLKAGTII